MPSEEDLHLAAGLLLRTKQNIDEAVDLYRQLQPRVTPSRARKLFRGVQERMAAGDIPPTKKATPHRKPKVPKSVMAKALKVFRRGSRRGGLQRHWLSYKEASLAAPPSPPLPLTQPPAAPQACSRSPTLLDIMFTYRVKELYIWTHAKQLDPQLGMIPQRPKVELSEKVKKERLAFANKMLKQKKQKIINAYFGDEARVMVQCETWTAVGRRGEMDVKEDARCNPNTHFYGFLSYFMVVHRGMGIAYLARLSCSKGLKPLRRYQVSRILQYDILSFIRGTVEDKTFVVLPLSQLPGRLEPRSPPRRVPAVKADEADAELHSRLVFVSIPGALDLVAQAMVSSSVVLLAVHLHQQPPCASPLQHEVNGAAVIGEHLGLSHDSGVREDGFDDLVGVELPVGGLGAGSAALFGGAEMATEFLIPSVRSLEGQAVEMLAAFPLKYHSGGAALPDRA